MIVNWQFLDTEIEYKNDGSLINKVYRKTTHTNKSLCFAVTKTLITEQEGSVALMRTESKKIYML